MEIVPLDDHLDEFKRHYKRKNKPRNRDNNRLRKIPNHLVNAAVPSRRRLSYLCCYVTDLFVNRVKQPRKVIRDSGNKKLFQPLSNGFLYSVYIFLLSGARRARAPCRFSR